MHRRVDLVRKRGLLSGGAPPGALLVDGGAVEIQRGVVVEAVGKGDSAARGRKRSVPIEDLKFIRPGVGSLFVHLFCERSAGLTTPSGQTHHPRP
jgi:hypothetical protein